MGNAADSTPCWRPGRHRVPAVVAELQARGIAAAEVLRPDNFLDDPALTARRHCWTADHPIAGPIRIAGNPILLSRTPAYATVTLGDLGHDVDRVLRHVLGYGTDAIADLAAQEVFE